MTNNAYINMTLEDLFAILDTRIIVYIFEPDEVGGNHSIRKNVSIYELLADSCFMDAYREYKVIGLNKSIGQLSILIEDE